MKKKEMKSKEDWYCIRASSISQSGGKTLLDLYGNSVASLVMNVYPSFPWNPWKFHTSSRSHAQDWDAFKEVCV